MRFILIDPVEKMVSVIELADAELETLYRTLDCEMVQTIELPSGDDLIIDEEALLRPVELLSWWIAPSIMTQPLAGRALVAGLKVTVDGIEWTDTRTPVAQISQAIRFLEPKQAATAFRWGEAKRQEWIKKMRDRGETVIDGGIPNPFESEE